MGKSPRYMTYKTGELEATLRDLDPRGRRFGGGASRDGMGSETGRSATGLITAHSCPVSYPDGTAGICRYTRAGPAWHVFRFEHTGKRSGKTASLPVQNETERVPNTIAAIEEAAHRLASRAFSAAARQEQRDYFQRATPPFHHKAESGEHPQMKTKEAKEASGKYALCLRVGRSLLPTGDTWNTLEEAVTAWQASGNLSLVIGCCCRWKRRWEEPVYNPLHADSRYPLLFPCPGDESEQRRATGTVQTPYVTTERVAVATQPSVSSEEDEDEDGEDEWTYFDEDEEPEDTGEMPVPPGDADAPIDQPNTSPDPFFEGIDNT